MSKEKIKVSVYDILKEFNSSAEAIEYFEKGCEYCDPNSSEYARYKYIIFQLKSGSTFATDESY